MRYLSVCSGIEAATVAWHPLGWEPAAFSEIEAFPRAVLAHHYPDVPNWGDMTKFKEWPDADVDVLVGGTPCQSFSVAGLRKGMDDPRGNLALTYLAIAARYRPQWLVWENVPGVLSSNGGRDFGSILGGMVELGYGIAYRVLDAQYFNLAQRRARVFVVGHLGDWRRAAAVLFERESLLGNHPPSREAGERVAPTTGARPTGGGGLGTDFDCDGGLIADTLSAARAGDISPTLRAGGHDKSHANGGVMAFGGNNTSGPIDVATACQANGSPHGRLDFGSETFISHSLRAEGFDASEAGTGRGREDGSQFEGPHDTANIRAASGGSSRSYVAQSAVRRLTPAECCRLQGFPDDYLTQVTWRGKCPPPDGPMYKALGNSMAGPVMRWIDERIQMVEAIAAEQAAA